MFCTWNTKLTRQTIFGMLNVQWACSMSMWLPESDRRDPQSYSISREAALINLSNLGAPLNFKLLTQLLSQCLVCATNPQHQSNTKSHRTWLENRTTLMIHRMIRRMNFIRVVLLKTTHGCMRHIRQILRRLLADCHGEGSSKEILIYKMKFHFQSLVWEVFTENVLFMNKMILRG